LERDINGEYYDGEWRRGKAHGFGIHVWSNGDKYDGEWYRSLKHGRGKDYFHTGDSYEGEYRYGKFEGTGTFKWTKGMVYNGQFKEGMRHGNGEWVEDAEGNGASYSGEYHKDKKHGIGIYKWPSGNEYRGNYNNDKREGYGEMYWTDGSFYKGEWIGGIQHGKGKITFADGLVKEGQFMNNMYVDSKNYQYTIDQDDPNKLLNKSVYSQMPRSSFTALNNHNQNYADNHATQKRRYSKHEQLINSHEIHRNHNAYHSPEQVSTKFNIEKLHDVRQSQLSYTTPYNKRHKNMNSHTFDDHNRHHSMHIEEKYEYDDRDRNAQHPYRAGEE
jgi:hypothetical protein